MGCCRCLGEQQQDVPFAGSFEPFCSACMGDTGCAICRGSALCIPSDGSRTCPIVGGSGNEEPNGDAMNIQWCDWPAKYWAQLERFQVWVEHASCAHTVSSLRIKPA